MSKVDTVFGPIPGPLIQEWGLPMVFVRNTGPGVYNSVTGEVTTVETRLNVVAVITKVNPKEYSGIYQATDLKILIDPAQVGGIDITTQDHWEYREGSTTRTAKVIDITAYRGDNPVFFSCIARPQ